MSWLDTIADLLVPAPVETRSDPWVEVPDLNAQLALLRLAARPWRTSSITEALGVPAIFRAVTLISNTVASLSMEAYRQGAKLPQENAPRLIVRPNPLTTPREFFRDTAYAMASRGEAWWWIASRDTDGAPLSLFPVPPAEVVVVENTRNRLRPTITWRDQAMKNEDMIQIPLTREPGALRGFGPLQACGAAVSVSVEAQEWAANFFAMGGVGAAPIIKSAVKLEENEAAALKAQWIETPNNTPKVIDPGVENVQYPEINPASAQLDEQRQFQNGEAARMFGIPGALMEYSAAGSSLTYQNVTEVYTQFLKTCLAPNYLEPIEQAISDLLTRSTVSRFNVDGLLRADIKTRYEVHTAAITAGVYDAPYAQRLEGIAPGDVENAPVPAAPPQAVPTILPYQARAAAVRCSTCNKLLAETATPPYRMSCPRCKAITEDVTDYRSLSAVDAVDGLKLAIHSLQQPPVVNVAPTPLPEIHIDAAPAPIVNVHTDSFVEAIADLKEMLARPKAHEIIRNDEGRIVGLKAS